MRILFVTHTSAWSGAESALMRLLENLRDDHEIAIACPPTGTVAERMDAVGIRRFSLPAVETSFRLDPVQTPLGLGAMVTAGVKLAVIARRYAPDVIHAATVRAGLIGAIASRAGGPPLIVHVHDHLPDSPLGSIVRRMIAGAASEVVAVSGFTAADFNRGLPHPIAQAVYNGIDHTRFDPDAVMAAPLREELGLDPGAQLLGVVGQITPWKGQATAVRVLGDLRQSGLDAHLMIVGRVTFDGPHVRYDNHAYMRELHRVAEDPSVAGAVHFLDFRDDVPAVLAALDLLLLPSWDEPFALVVMESLAMGTPALVGDVGGAAEVLHRSGAGVALPPHDRAVWSRLAHELLTDPERRADMAGRARSAAAPFRDDAHAREVLRVYDTARRRAAGAAP